MNLGSGAAHGWNGNLHYSATQVFDGHVSGSVYRALWFRETNMGDERVAKSLEFLTERS